MKRFLNGVKGVFKDFFNYIKKKFGSIWETLRIFFSILRNWLMLIFFIVAIVFICMWNVNSYFKLIGVGSLTVAIGLLAWYITIFYMNFVKFIEIQKRAILEDLAVQFDKKEYLDLKTPFNEKDERDIVAKEKGYKNIMIGCWACFAISLFVFIAMLF